MIIEKVTEGVVIQTFDTNTNEFTEQRFITGPCTWEHESGRPVDDKEFDYTKWYLPFDMVQPDNEKCKGFVNGCCCPNCTDYRRDNNE